LKLMQPGTMFVSPLLQEGFTASGIYIEHAANNHYIKPCLSVVQSHVVQAECLIGHVVLHRQNALVEICGSCLDPQYILCDANVRAVLENHPASSHRYGGPMRLRPLFNQVVIQLDPPKTVDEWGLAIPETSQELPCEGTVVAIGPEVTCAHNKHLSKERVFEGTRVAFLKFSGSTLTIDKVDYLVVKETALLAILDDEKPKDVPAAYAGEGHGMAISTLHTQE
jgi:co-chaperonin GroES (HSP10)